MSLFIKKSIGIDIADHTIEVVELLNSHKSIAIVNTGRIRLSPGIIVQGRIKDTAKLTDAVTQLFKESKPNALVPEHIILGLPESQTYVHTFTLPREHKQEIEKFVQEEAETNIPIQSNDLLFSHKILFEDKEKIEVILVASSKEVVLEWQDFFESLNICVQAFDIEPLAVFRGLSLSQPQNPIGIIDMGAVSTRVAIFDKNGLRNEFVINVGGEHFTEEIARLLQKKHEMIDASLREEAEKVNNKEALLTKTDEEPKSESTTADFLEEAEALKKEIGVSSKDEFFTALDTLLKPMVADIKKTFTYFSEKTGTSVGEIILVGGSSNLKGLTDYFSKKLNVPTTIGKQALVKSDTPLEYIEAIGLALRGLDEKRYMNEPSILPVQKENEKNKPTVTKGDRFPQMLQDKTKHTGDEEEDEKVSESKLRTQKIILLALLLVGVTALPAAYWYRGYQKTQRESEMQARLDQIDATAMKLVPQEVSTTTNEIVASTTDSINVTSSTTNATSSVILDESSDQTQIEKQVRILETPTGFLNVRSGPGKEYEKIAQIYPGEIYPLVEERDDWYKVRIRREVQDSGTDEEVEGWVISQYAIKQ